jgi:hypothetical protein
MEASHSRRTRLHTSTLSWQQFEKGLIMIRKIALGAAAALLVVGLPVAALGISNSINSSDDTQAQVTTAAPAATDAASTTAQDQTQARQRLRTHAETGIPEGTTPTQARQRLHAQDQTGAQSQGHGQQSQGQHGQGQGQGQGHGQHGRGQGGNQQGMQSGNSGHNGSDTPGECTNPDGPVGNGPNGASS